MIESWCKEEVVSLAFNIMNSMSTVFITLLCLFLEATLVLISQWTRKYWISSCQEEGEKSEFSNFSFEELDRQTNKGQEVCHLFIPVDAACQTGPWYYMQTKGVQATPFILLKVDRLSHAFYMEVLWRTQRRFLVFSTMVSKDACRKPSVSSISVNIR